MLAHPPRTFPIRLPTGHSHLVSGLDLDVSTAEDILAMALRSSNQGNAIRAHCGSNRLSPFLGSPDPLHQTQAQPQSITNMSNASTPPPISLQTMLAIERAKQMVGFASTESDAAVQSHRQSQQVSSGLVKGYQHQPSLPQQGYGTGTSVCSAQSTETNTSINKKETTPERRSPSHGAFDGEQDLQSAEVRKKRKRVANRISAQQSRKRKQQFVEDLREENEQIRKMCRVMAMLPDLVISFDSAGIISFVSHASEHVFGSTPDILIGESFWSLICPKSTRRIKAAFMDALAASREKSGCPSVCLGAESSTKSWQIQIKEKKSDGSADWVPYALYGVVHFGESSPECVCTIRLAEEQRKPKVAVV
eukprot:Nitzschia sp. Nitz4//NODE_202_length_38933_cov_72.610268//26801//27973//NITZ4_additional_000025-RA//-1//CDS//3329531795//3189//frame0